MDDGAVIENVNRREKPAWDDDVERLVLYADFMGNQMDIDQGTYEIDMETYSFIIHFDNAGDLTTEGYADDD